MVNSAVMSNPFGGLNVLKNWKAGDTWELTQKELNGLHGTPAYDSYSGTYHFNGLTWRIVGQMSRADGETVFTLQATSE